MADKWKAGIARDRRPDGAIRHSQIISTFGPGALLDLVDDAAIVAGLSYWARGERIVEDRLVSMLSRQEGYEKIALYSPPVGGQKLEQTEQRWIKAFRFPEWFICQNENCWEQDRGTKRSGGARPRRSPSRRTRLARAARTGRACPPASGCRRARASSDPRAKWASPTWARRSPASPRRRPMAS